MGLDSNIPWREKVEDLSPPASPSPVSPPASPPAVSSPGNGGGSMPLVSTYSGGLSRIVSWMRVFSASYRSHKV